MSDTFFTADTHFNHANIIEFCHRPFSSMEKMNEELIRRWNAIVTPKDTVWHLGDFAWKNGDQIFDRLNGHKHLILGNHDDAKTRRCKWESISEYKRLRIGEDRIILFHFPIETWLEKDRGAFHLHGHVHGRSVVDVNKPGKADVGVDSLLSVYSPWSWKELKNFLTKSESRITS